MYEVSLTRGYVKITFAGRVGVDEMKEWLAASRTAMSQPNPPELFMIDLRELNGLTKDTIDIIAIGQRGAKASGLKRSAVIVKSAIIKMQFERMAKTTGIFEKERYISAETNPNWEKAAEAWILHGSEPA
jgi:hypothetical protein